MVQKICKTRKKTPLEPLDLLAMVGQSCVCESGRVLVSVSVSVCVCVCVEMNDVAALWR